ncbi:MAG: hypothetical protein OXF57_10290, partial [Rhodospirillaceae bacterium]|nr:hypothetical protein [Rhodospirillaceae bacterium]
MSQSILQHAARRAHLAQPGRLAAFSGRPALPALWHHRSKERAAMNLDHLPRVRRAHLPTPL